MKVLCFSSEYKKQRKSSEIVVSSVLNANVNANYTDVEATYIF